MGRRFPGAGGEPLPGMATGLRRGTRTVPIRWLGGRQSLLLLPLACVYGALAVMPVAIVARLSVENGLGSFAKLFSSAVFYRAVDNTLAVSVETTVLSVLLAYPLAAWLWQSRGVTRAVLLGFVLLPFWTAALIKNFAWAVLLQDNGPLNQALMALGVSAAPVTLLHTRFAVVVGMVHYALPYAVFPIYTAMLAIDERLGRAARSLGASSAAVAWLVILPLTRPGVYAASLLVFIVSTGFYITPVVLGSPRELMVANLVDFYAHQLVDFGTAAALSVLVIAAASVLVAIYQAMPKEGQHGAV